MLLRAVPAQVDFEAPEPAQFELCPEIMPERKLPRSIVNAISPQHGVPFVIHLLLIVHDHFTIHAIHVVKGAMVIEFAGIVERYADARRC